MKRILKSATSRTFVDLRSAPEDKEVIPFSDLNKPVFSVSQMKITPPRTADDVRRAIAEGRVAEMTPDLAG